MFARNIAMVAYWPIGMPGVWGQEIDHNLLPDEAALEASRRAGRDMNSVAGDPMFVDSTSGDYRVKDDSPALKVGFKNFPMDQFGVTRPELKKIARTPRFTPPGQGRPRRPSDDRELDWLGAKVKSVTTEGERSSAGLPSVAGVMVLEVPAGSAAERNGLQRRDVILECNGRPIANFNELRSVVGPAQPGSKVKLGVMRNQQVITLEVEPRPRPTTATSF